MKNALNLKIKQYEDAIFKRSQRFLEYDFKSNVERSERQLFSELFGAKQWLAESSKYIDDQKEQYSNILDLYFTVDERQFNYSFGSFLAENMLSVSDKDVAPFINGIALAVAHINVRNRVLNYIIELSPNSI